MQGHNLQVADWTQQLAGLVVLAGCAAMATDSKPKVSLLPAVEGAGKFVEQKTRKKKDNLSPEVREFMQLPPLIQRQVLDYAKSWINANFEPENSDLASKA